MNSINDIGGVGCICRAMQHIRKAKPRTEQFFFLYFIMVQIYEPKPNPTIDHPYSQALTTRKFS